jgi:hypothetical protein
MPAHDEIDLQNLDRLTLTPELWGRIKAQAVHRANTERMELIAQVVRGLAFWRSKGSERREVRSNPGYRPKAEIPGLA